MDGWKRLKKVACAKVAWGCPRLSCPKWQCKVNESFRSERLGLLSRVMCYSGLFIEVFWAGARKSKDGLLCLHFGVAHGC